MMIVVHANAEIAGVTGLDWCAVALVITSDGGPMGPAAAHGDHPRHAMTAGRGR
jgi:hypothetical protein